MEHVAWLVTGARCISLLSRWSNHLELDVGEKQSLESSGFLMARQAVGRSGDDNGPHPTRQLLIDSAVQLMETTNPEDVRIEDVLAQAGLTSGAIYHHFDNFPDLVDQAVIHRYIADLEASYEAVAQIIAAATDVKSLAAGLRATTTRGMAADRANQRFARAQVMARAAANQRFGEALRPHQMRLNDVYSGLVEELQAKGLFDPAVDPVAGALFVQAYSLGFVVNDVSGNPAADEEIVALILRVLERSFFADPPA